MGIIYLTPSLNDGNVKRQTLDRLDSFIVATRGRGITYKALTA